MKKKLTLFLVMIQMTILGVAQTPKDMQKIEQQIAQSRKGKSSDDGGSQDGGSQDGGSQDGGSQDGGSQDGGEVTPVVPE